MMKPKEFLKEIPQIFSVTFPLTAAIGQCDACSPVVGVRVDCQRGTSVPYRIYPGSVQQSIGHVHHVVSSPFARNVAVLNEGARRCLEFFESPGLVENMPGNWVEAWGEETVRATVEELVRLGVLVPSKKGAVSLELTEVPTTLAAWLHLTDRCNLRCAYCYVPHRATEMSLETGMAAIDATVRSAVAHQYQEVKLKYAGGEPLLRFDLIRHLHQYAQQLTTRYGLELDGVVLSNGTLLTAEMVREMQALGLRLMISLDGVSPSPSLSPQGRGAQGSPSPSLSPQGRGAQGHPSPSLSPQGRGAQGFPSPGLSPQGRGAQGSLSPGLSHQGRGAQGSPLSGQKRGVQRMFLDGRDASAAAMQGIELALAYGLVPDISITVSGRNVAGLPALLAWVLERDLPFSLNFYREHAFSADTEGLRLEDESFIEGMLKAYKVIEANLPRRSLLASLVDRGNLAAAHLRTCSVGRNYLVYNTDGQVAKCQMQMQTPVTTVLAEDPLAAVRADMRGIQNISVEAKEGCRSCQWKYWCAGSCPLETYRTTGRYDLKSPHCNIYKALYPEVLRLEGLRLLKYAEE